MNKLITGRGFWAALFFLGVLLIVVLCYDIFEKSERHAASEPILPPAVLILNYHMVKPEFSSLAIDPEDFEQQLVYLQNHGYTTISPSELYAAIEGREALPKNPVLITFDDGYKDNYTIAFPLLKKYHMKATIFVVTNLIGTNANYFTWDEAREMEKSGISIESHTATHRSLTDLSDDDIIRELVGSREKAESELGHPVEYIAYPTGTYNLHIAKLVREAGYKAAFTIKYSNVDYNSNIYALERVPVFRTGNTYRDFSERLSYMPNFAQFGWARN